MMSKNNNFRFQMKWRVVLPAILTLLALSLLSNALSAATGTFQLDKQFKIRVPEGWTFAEFGAAGFPVNTPRQALLWKLAGVNPQNMAAIFWEKQDSIFANNFSVVIIPENVQIDEAWAVLLRQQFRNRFEALAERDLADFNFMLGLDKGQKWIEGRFSVDDPELGQAIVTRQYWLPGAGRAFLLTFNILASDRDRLEPVFPLVAGSVRDLSSNKILWSDLPGWLQFLLIASLILIVISIVSALVRRWKQAHDEVVVFTKEESPSVGTVSRPSTEQRQTTRTTTSPPQEQRTPPQPQTPAPGGPTQERNRIPNVRKRGIIPMIFFAIILVNIIRQCIQNN